MGVLITCEKPPATSGYDYWKCYRADTKTGSYSVINGTNGQVVTDLTYYDTAGTATNWYKISYYNTTATTESALSDPLKALAETYTTVRKVESLLQLGTTLTDATRPTVQEVVELINRVEDEIDRRTNHSWRLRYSGTTTGFDTTQAYEYYDIHFARDYQTGIPIYMGHRKIRTFSSSEGDVIEVFEGNGYSDWLTGRTEGRENDYWCDYEQGMLYLMSYYFSEKPKGIRIKYRYGESIVPKDIEDIATKMVAIELLMSDDRTTLLPEGSSNMSQSQKIDKWTDSVEKKLQNFKEFPILRSML